jgi:hypothetical protein
MSLHQNCFQPFFCVVLANTIYVYSFESTPQKLAVFETGDNDSGIVALCNSLNNSILAFPGRSPGQIQLADLSLLSPVLSMDQAASGSSSLHRNDSNFSLPNNGGFTGPCNINDRWDEGKMCAMMAIDEMIFNKMTEVRIYGDSQLVINLVTGRYKSKKPHLKSYTEKCRQKLREFKKHEINWIPREQNKKADEFSR